MNSTDSPHKILGIGSSLGSRRITNKDLESRLSLSAEQIESKTGIKHRFHCDPVRENLYVLMTSAVDQALNSANIPVERIDGVFSACNPTGELLLPNTSTIVASLLNMGAFYNGGNGVGCSGGLIALDMAFNKLEKDSRQGRIRNYLVITGDQTSAMIESGSSDEMLFSDGASALILSNDRNTEEYYRVEDVDNITYHKKANALKLRRDHPILEHDGGAVYTFAIRSMSSILDMLGVDKFPEETYLIPHQANLRIINRLTEAIDPNLVYREGIVNIGNTSPASVFIGLEEVNRKRLSPYDNIVLATFGEGLTIAMAKLKANFGKTLPERLDDDQLKDKHMETYKSKW